MKLWRIPWPWDYHLQGELIVMASTKEAALKIAKAYVEKGDSSYKHQPNFDEITMVDDKVVENEGCDC